MGYLAKIGVPGTVAICLAAVLGASAPAYAFTQSFGTNASNIIPMGHEWITRMAAAEVLGYAQGKAPDVPDPQDPRRTWRPQSGAAWNPSVSSPGAQAIVRAIMAKPDDERRYASRFKPVFDAIVGERWVDLGGYPLATVGGYACWDAVAQQPAEIQYDHFMRRYDDVAGEGGVKAAQTSQERFVNFFVAAATAKPMQISTYDGGGTSDPVIVDRTYFLFGRAAHEFEDSFSSEHTVRIPLDNFIKVRQVKSYLCALGSEQHTHLISAIFDYSSGDVIWKDKVDRSYDPTWTSYKASNMKPVALVAVEATKDLWAAFIRTLAVPADQRADAAKNEADLLVKHWLSYDRDQMSKWYDDQDHRDRTYVLANGESGVGMSQAKCMSGLSKLDQAAYVRELEATQRKCLYNARPWNGYADQFDPELHIWYSWRWLHTPDIQNNPPADWRIPNQQADLSTIVGIKSLANQKYMTAPGGLGNRVLLFNLAGAPVRFAKYGADNATIFRSADDPLLFLSYRSEPKGRVQLYKPDLDDPSTYDLRPASHGGLSIMETYWKQYMWLDGDEPVLNRSGKPYNLDANWRLDVLP